MLACNPRQRRGADRLVPRAEEAMGQLDILVANAGVTKDNLFVQIEDRGSGIR